MKSKHSQPQGVSFSLCTALALACLSLGAACDEQASTPEGADAPALRDGDCGPTRQQLEKEADEAACGVGHATAIDMTKPSVWGISADDLMSLAGGSHRSEIQWSWQVDAPEDSSALSVEIAPVGSAEIVQYDGECADRLRVDVKVAVQSEDGLLDETYTGQIVQVEGGRAHLDGWFDVGSVEGEFEDRLDIGDQCLLDHQIFMTFDDGAYDDGDSALATFALSSNTRSNRQLGDKAHTIELVGGVRVD